MKKKTNYLLLILFMIFIQINGVDALERTCVVCGNNTYPIPSLLPTFVSRLVLLIQVGVPIVLIVVSMINYLKAVASGDAKVMSDTNHKFIRSIIAGVAIFLVLSIVKFAFTTLDNASGNDDSTNSCVTCFITGDCGKNVECQSSRG